MTEFTKNVVEIIKSIPRGSVLTYGIIAAQAGNPRGARQVARILHSLTEKEKLPWYRVINSQGKISLEGEGADIQENLLLQEGVLVENGKIDLKKYLFVIK